MALPRLRLLGYEEAQPHLRLIRLPELTVEPSPVPLDRADSALDGCMRRDGWIAFKSEEVWGAPIPLEGEAFRVGKSFGWLPSRNERAIWMMDGHIPFDAPHTYIEYDGVAREVVDQITLPAGARLVAERDVGLIVHDHRRGWSAWQRGAATGEPIDERHAAPHGSLLLSESEPDRLILIATGGEEIEIALPIDEFTNRSLSPDGRYHAVDIDVSGDRQREIESMVDVVQGRAKYEPVPHRLALIDCTNGQVTFADGVFDNFASPPVWSHDSEWLVFAAPFTRDGLWVCRVADARLEWVGFGKSTPVPLVNVSDVIPD